MIIPLMRSGFDYTGIFAVFLCHDGQGNFLMAKRGMKARDEQGKWEFGGGGIEFTESPEAAVRRELMEEYNCRTIHSLIPLNPFSLVREQENKQTHWIGFPFAVQIDPSEVRINEPEHIDSIGWFTLDALPDPLHPGVHRVISAYMAHRISG